MTPRDDSFIRRTGLALGVATLFVFTFLGVFYAGHVLLVAFAGFLLALYLHGLARFVGRVLPGKTRWHVGGVLLVHAGALVLFAWYVAPALEAQARELADRLPEAVERLRSYLASTSWGRPALGALPDTESLSSGRVWGAFTSGFSGLVDVVVILIVGIYGALEPETYRRGLLLLFPPRHRTRAAEVSAEAVGTLRHFLLGLFASAAIIGVCSSVGLALLGVPLPVLMGLVAALLTFVPNIGPILSVIPPALLALLQSPQQALWVLLLYLGLQFLESYVVTPMIQRRAVKLPPAMLVLAQVLLGVLGGPLGIAMAAPLTALGLVLTRELYVKEPELLPEPHQHDDDDDGDGDDDDDGDDGASDA